MEEATTPALTLLRVESAKWEPADPKTFTGRARIRRMGGAGSSPTVKLYRVAFDEGARTHWHVHSGAQLLVVLEGRCLVQRSGGPVEAAEVGDVVHIAPGVKHWHGAGRGAPATHVAINVDAETTWLEQAPDTDG
jgi:4-carboxymuconolactone decarboxylase